MTRAMRLQTLAQLLARPDQSEQQGISAWRPSRTLWVLLWAAAASLVLALFLQYEGEEPFSTISAQEMWANRQFLVTTHYGRVYPRPGLFPLLIAGVSNILGWSNVLIAARAARVGSLPSIAENTLAGVAAGRIRQLAVEGAGNRPAVAPPELGGDGRQGAVGGRSRAVHNEGRRRQGLECGRDVAAGVEVSGHAGTDRPAPRHNRGRREAESA
jgi:hypothetical protein